MYQIDTPSNLEHATLITIWESSIRATHHFVTEEDLQQLKQLIREKYLNLVDLFCLRDDSKSILGFIGVSGENLEMLFIDPDLRGRGIGKTLLFYAVGQLKIRKVDVNEQNTTALAFYVHFGFEIISRSELDGNGKPYPILHMQLIQHSSSLCYLH